MRTGGNARTIRCAANCSAPRWMGMAAACAMVSPWTLKSAAEASSPSFTIGEAALLSSVSSISSAMASRRLRSTSSRTGSMATPLMRSPSPETQVAGTVHERRVPRRDHRRGVRLLDDGRSQHAGPDSQSRAVVEGSRDEAIGREVGTPLTDARVVYGATGTRRRAHDRPRERVAVHRAEVDELRRLLRARIAVDPLVHRVEGAHDLGDAPGGDRSEDG